MFPKWIHRIQCQFYLLVDFNNTYWCDDDDDIGDNVTTGEHENNQRYWIINVGCYYILWKDQLERHYETFIPMNNFKVDKDKISRSTFCFLHCVVGRGINKSGGMGGMSLKSWKQFTSPPKKCILSQGAMTKILYRLK